MSCEISLTRGLIALFDDEDFELVNSFKWHANRGRSLNEVWYAYACLGKAQAMQFGKRHLGLHRLLMDFPKAPLMVDHINGNGLDNRRENLRIVNASQNQMNRVGNPRRTNKYSKHKGVTWRSKNKTWQVSICAYGVHRHIGYFADEVEAALAYDREAILHHGEFALLNFPNEGMRKGEFESPRPKRTLGPQIYPTPSDQDDAKSTT